ncbi:hypothetical protein [Neorhizobium petrolearium]|uniref:hypothetical protein n=1 Tax=Neorhizobium petrolearium TaxID=515361 RepID=UPI003F7D7EC9
MLRKIGRLSATAYIVATSATAASAADWSFYTSENGIVDLSVQDDGTLIGSYKGFTKQGSRFEVPIKGANPTEGVFDLNFDFGGHTKAVQLKKTGDTDGFRTWKTVSGELPNRETEMTAPLAVATAAAADLAKQWYRSNLTSYGLAAYRAYLLEKQELLKEAFGEAYSPEAFSETVGIIDSRRNYSRWQVATSLALDETAGIQTLGTGNDIAMISVPDALLTNDLTPTILQNSGIPMEPPPSIFPQSTKTARIPVRNVFHTLYSQGVLAQEDSTEFMSLFAGRDCRMHPPRPMLIAATCEPHRVCRRPQLVRSRVYDKQNDEQVFS